MRIGIDLDDTICKTTEIVDKRLEEYSKEINISPQEIMNDEVEKNAFFNKYIKDIYDNVKIKKHAADVIRRLQSKGNEIYIVTARSNELVENMKDALTPTANWLKKNGIEPNKIIISAYGDKKALICEKEKIDLMIEDNPYNCKKIKENNIKCLLFDDKERYNLREDYVTNWIELENYIERNK